MAYNTFTTSITPEKLQYLFDTCSTKTEILQKLNIKFSSWSMRKLSEQSKKFNIDESTLNLNRDRKYKSIWSNQPRNITVSLDNIFKENGHTISNTQLRKKIFKHNLIKYECLICKNIGNHMGLPLTLQLDHIDGITSNNRLENLRFLCPNCHTQTPTYGSKNIKRCKNVITKSPRIYKTKITWPDVTELTLLVNSYPLAKISTLLNVSDNAIKKHCSKYNISLKPQGFWLKKEHALGIEPN
jgi:5-methylcytosine-specific restriction endonuclease McrA